MTKTNQQKRVTDPNYCKRMGALSSQKEELLNPDDLLNPEVLVLYPAPKCTKIFESFQDFSCFVSSETEAINNSPISPPFFNAKSRGKLGKFKERTSSFWRAGKQVFDLAPKLEEEFELVGSEKLGLTPKFLQNLWLWSSLQTSSSTGFLLCETFYRTFLQNHKGSAEFWGGDGGEPGASKNRKRGRQTGVRELSPYRR